MELGADGKSGWARRSGGREKWGGQGEGKGVDEETITPNDYPKLETVGHNKGCIFSSYIPIHPTKGA